MNRLREMFCLPRLPGLLPKALTWSVTLMQLWVSMLMSLALVTTKVPVDNWRLATTFVQADVQGMSSHRAMPIQDFCTANWDHGDVQPRLLPEAMNVSGSLALWHLASELTSEGCAEACSLG